MKIPTSYKIATVITALPLWGLLFRHPLIAVPLLFLLFAPYVISNSKWKQYVYFAALSVFLIISAYAYFTFIRTLLTTESMTDFEGPNGEGSPIAPIVGMFMTTLLFIIPWTIASIKGFKLLALKKIDEQELRRDNPYQPFCLHVSSEFDLNPVSDFRTRW